VRRADLDPAFLVSLGTGKTRYLHSQNPLSGDDYTTLSTAPQATVQLASPLGTLVSVSVPTSINLGGAEIRGSTPTVSVTQPLNKLLGMSTDPVGDLTRGQGVESARIALARQMISVEKDVVTRLRALWAGESALGELAVQIEGARTDLDEARTLGTYAAGSAGLARLEQALRSLEHKRTLQEAKQQRALRDLSRVVGRSVDAPPSELPAADLALPPEKASAAGPDVRTAITALRVEQERYREDFGDKSPELTVTGSFSRSLNTRIRTRDVREYTATETSAQVGVAFDHLTIKAGPGVIQETGTVYFGAEVTWTPPANKLDELDRRKQLNAIAAKQAAVAAAERAFAESLSELESRVLDLSLQAEDIAQSGAVAESSLREAEARSTRGLADARELREARWAVASVGYQQKLLAADRLLARADVEALTLQAKEKM
jgi:hypothetical protein